MLKFLQKKFLFSLFFCAIQLHCLHAKKFGGGGGGFRGGGAARANPPPAGGHFGGGGAPVGGGQPHFAGGGGAGAFHGPTGGGGFHPPPAGGFHGPPMSAGSGPGRFGTGTGLGSSGRAGTFTSALAGAAVGTVGGLVAFEAGKAIIHSFDRPFQHDGRDYYLDEKYAKKRHGEIQCKMPWDTLFNQSLASNQSTNGTAPEQSLANATFPNGSRPKEIVWTCKEHVEICCGMDCCPNPQHTPSSSEAKSGGGMGTVGKVFLGILVVALLFCCCCALLTYTSCRSIFDSCLPGNNNNQNYDQTHKFEGAGDNAHNPSGQAYPMQPYYPPPPAPNNYPAQPQATAVYPQTYPAQPQAQAGYPPNPTSYPQAPGY